MRINGARYTQHIYSHQCEIDYRAQARWIFALRMRSRPVQENIPTLRNRVAVRHGVLLGPAHHHHHGGELLVAPEDVAVRAKYWQGHRLFSGRLVKNYVAPMWTQALTGWYE